MTPDVDLVATSESSDRTSFKCQYSSQYSEILDLWLAPNGDMKKLIEKFKRSAVLFEIKLTNRNLSKIEV